MMNEMGLRRALPGQSSGSAHTFGTPRHPSVIDPILSKRVCFYKSGDPQFNGLRMVINNRTFKTFDALLDSLSKKVPLPFGVRNITTPHGIHGISTLDDLEDGKSYICSDNRKVKPFNLAQARKKPPPWYHARPVSSRRRTVQKARLFPGKNNQKKEPVVLRTPKRLLVFRNGDPNVKHTVVINKRTTPTFESILEYISELIQFQVVKLLTSDGKRVDGLPGLILCSGTVVAAGREPFKHANYSDQNSPAQSFSTRKSVRRLKALNRQKKHLSNTPKPRPFSPSSERYIVNQIHNSITGSSNDLRSNPSNSVEWESGHMLESVAETDGETYLGDGAEGQGCLLPTDDDIEKSFRVNQDGSMTVEMKVRLTLKEEETIQWTTTLTRSSVANELNETSLPPPPEEEERIMSPNSNSINLQSPVASINSINKDKTKDNNDEDPPTPCYEAFRESSIEEDNIKVQTGTVSPRRAPTPGHKQIRTKQTSVESIKAVTPEGIHEGVVGSYSYTEQTEHGAMTEQYCLVKQSSTRPIPKPRRLESIDSNNMSSRSLSTFKSAGMSEILQVECSGEEVTETVLHIYEQQTCQDNFLANLCTEGMSVSEIPCYRPATSETAQFSSNNESEHELWRPSTASESTNFWGGCSTSLASDLTLPLPKTRAIPEANAQRRLQKVSKDKDKLQQNGIKYDKPVPAKPKLNQKRVRRLMTPKKRQKERSPEATDKPKKVKTFSSAGFLRKIYGGKPKPVKSTKRIKKGTAKMGGKALTTTSSQQSDDTLQSIPEDSTVPSGMSEIKMKTEESRLDVAPMEISQPRGLLTRQTSMHQEKKSENESYDISKSMSLPAFNSSSAFTNEYVENWLGKALLEPATYPEEESKKAEEVTLAKKGNGISRGFENENSLMTVAKEVKSLENKSDKESCTTLKINQLPETVLESSVKQRIQSFECKSSPLPERTAISQQTVHSPSTTRRSENHIILSQENTTLPTNEAPSYISPSSPVKISSQNATPSDALSADFPPPPSPPADTAELSSTEYCEMDVTPTASSPLYRLSSGSSQMSDNHPLSTSPSSEKAASPTDLNMERTASAQTSSLSAEGNSPLSRSPSIKRAPLVSNLSFGRTMALRRACMDKYTLGSDDGTETATSVPSMLQNGINSHQQTETQQPRGIEDLRNNHLCSSSTTSLSSEEKKQLACISSGDNQTPPLISPTETLPPKSIEKKVQLSRSPTPERKSQTRKLSSELSQKSPKLSTTHTASPDKMMSPRNQRHITPNASPLTTKKQMLDQSSPSLQKRLSPYSQSLDVVSPPIRRRSSKKSLAGNHSSDTSESSVEASLQKTSVRKNPPTMQSKELPSAPDKILSNKTVETVETHATKDNEVNKTDDLVPAVQENKLQITPQPLHLINQPDIKSVLEDICSSIKSIRLLTQNKRPSCLERSNSLPDFSSHVASTFGSSSKALLAFLAVMTLKEGLTNLNVDELNANNVSSAEALKMINSLEDIASIEDSHKLKDSLSSLQQSASTQLLESWRGFQKLSDQCSSSANNSGCLEKDFGIDGHIDEMMDNLDMPEKLREELAFLSPVFKSENDEKEKTSDRIIEELKPSENNDINAQKSDCSTPSANIVNDAMKDVDVSSIIKQFTSRSEQSRVGSVEETMKLKSPNQLVKDKNSHYGQSSVAKSPPPEPKVRQLNITKISEKEDTEAMESCHEEEERQQEDNNREIPGEDSANVIVVDSNTHVKQESCTSEVGEQVHNEESASAPEIDPSYDQKPGLEQERQNTSSANEDSEVSGDEGGPSSEIQEQHSSEKEAKVECDVSRENDDLSNHEGCSENEEDKESRSDNVIEEPSNEAALSSPASPSNSERELQKSGYMGVSVSVEDSTCNSDVDEQTTEEEQHKAESQDRRDHSLESLSVDEEEQESMEEEEHMDDILATREQGEVEKRVCLEEEDYLADRRQICDKTRSQNTVGDLSSSTENQDIYCKKDSLIQSNILAKKHEFSADEDSGNDHNSCEDHVEEEQPNEQISSSNEDELSYDGKNLSSEEEHITTDLGEEEKSVKNQVANGFAMLSEDTICEKAVEIPKHQSEDITSQSVAERVVLLEKQVADEQKRKNITDSPKRRYSQRNVPLEPNAEDSSKSQSMPGSRSAPQSSLSFSYDSSGVVTSEPESNRVRSIREMFLAKSATDIPLVNKPFQSSNSSNLVELRAQTSTSAGYESQNSNELSSGEDDSAQKSISKGFVRRTIERLYGVKNPNQEVGERPPSAPKEKKKEHSSIFSPFLTQSTAMPELSYFNSTSALDNLTEATRCIAFNAKVVPGHCVPVNDEPLLFSENTQIRKSVSEPAGINKNFTNSPEGEGMSKDTEENTSCSLPSRTEPGDKEHSFSRKCTYFSLPHASDSDACQDDLSIVSKESIVDVNNSEDAKMSAERNGMLPNVGVTDFKKMDNKVHPLTEAPPDGEVVVVQPGKGQGVMSRRLQVQDPDMLDVLYDFCGQNCPIL